MSENIQSLMAEEFPDRELIFTPWLALGELCLLFAPTGVGKTFFGIAAAYALSADTGDFLGQFARRGLNVVYFDGEMGRAQMARRLRKFYHGAGKSFRPNGLRLCSYEHHKNGMPNLADPATHEWYTAECVGADVVIIDNLNSVSAPMNRHDCDIQQWMRMQRWLIARREAGQAVILIHHTNKSGGAQLGTSQRENIMDVNVFLKPTELSEGGYEMHYAKTRNFYGDSTEPKLITTIDTDNGGLLLHSEPLPQLQAEVEQRRKDEALRKIKEEDDIF